MTWYKTTPVQRTPKYNVASGTVATFNTNLVAPLKSLTAQIVPIQEGTGTPSPSNPRPISGTSVLNVEQIENQLIYATAEDSGTISGITWSFSNGYLKLNGTTTAAVTLTFNLSDNVNLNPSDNRILFNNNADNSGVVVFFRRGTTTIHYWGMSPANRIGINWTDTGNENIDNVMVSITPNNTLNNFVVFPCLMLKTEEPTTTTIDLGQEIMGGTADVVGGVGSKTSGFAVYDGSEEWFEQSGTFRVPAPQDGYYDTGLTVCIDNCNLFNPSLSGNNTIRRGLANLVITTNSFSSLADFKASLSTTPLQIAYPLTTPTEYTFTGQPIRSLLGVNNVWTDSGEVLDVEYAYMPTGNSGAYFPAGSV